MAGAYFLGMSFRVLLAIGFGCAAFESLCQMLPRSLKAIVHRAYVRPLLFLILYSLLIRFVFVTKPAVSGFYYWYYPKVLFTVALAGLLVALLKQFWKPTALVVAPLRRALRALALCGLALVFTVFPAAPPQISSSTAKAKSPLPSFFLLGVDGIPASLLYETIDGRSYAPLWQKHWSPQSIKFENAYSVSNSTYTSWFSLFSGRYPFRSGVELLYPGNRMGSVDSSALLPALLKQKGYQTVFMTDCGATSYMPDHFGFEQRYQLGEGILGCGRSLFTSRHPFTYLFNLGETVFPELNNFCSALYNPKSFFDEVDKTAKRLDASGRPYFLVVHSCLTHQLVSHVPAVSSPLRDNFPAPLATSDKLRNLGLSLRLADYYVDKLWSESEKFQNPPWRIFLADHGVRIDKQANKLSSFTHGVGFPVNRFQYNVPLALLPPEGTTPLSLDPKALVGLIDLYPSLLHLASIKAPPNDGIPLWDKQTSPRKLLLTSAIPLRLDANNPELIATFWKNTLDSKGYHHFPPDLEADLRLRRSVAVVSWPYRLVYNPLSVDLLYNEATDPYGLYNLVGSKTEIARDLKAYLCNEVKEAPCTLRLPQPLGHFQAGDIRG